MQIAKPPRLVLIAAMTLPGRVIGNEGKIFWKMPTDMRRFREITTHAGVMIMGRKTFASFSKPLPNRYHVVLSRNQTHSRGDNFETVGSIDAAVAAASPHTKTGEVMVIGGAKIYEQFLPRADRLFITEVECDVVGDTFFPEIPEEDWYEVHRTPRQLGEGDQYASSLVMYGKIEKRIKKDA